MMGMMHPFDMTYNRPQYSPYQDALRRPAVAAAARRPEPQIDTSQDIDAFFITVRAPQGYKCEDTRASRRGATSLKIEGTLLGAPRSSVSTYVTRSRAGVFAEPSTRSGSLMGIMPAGRIVRGSAPSSRGWIALCSPEDDEESEAYMRDDGSLALTENGLASPHNLERIFPFAEHIDLPLDADIERGTSTPNADGSLTIRVPKKREEKKVPAIPTTRMTNKVRVAHSPHVYVRAAPNLRAPAIGVKSVGDVVRVSEEVNGWLRLADEKGWMLRDGSTLGLGALVQPVAADEPATPRVAHSNTSPSKKHQLPAHETAATRPRPRRPPVQAVTAANTSTATGAKAARPAPSNNTTNSTDLPRAAEKKKKAVDNAAVVAPAGIDVLRSGESSALLSECSASIANIQRPVEVTEHWMAMEDGSFAPLAIG